MGLKTKHSLNVNSSKRGIKNAPITIRFHRDELLFIFCNPMLFKSRKKVSIIPTVITKENFNVKKKKVSFILFLML